MPEPEQELVAGVEPRGTEPACKDLHFVSETPIAPTFGARQRKN